MANTIAISVVGDTRNLQRNLGTASKQVSGLGKVSASAGSLLKGALLSGGVLAAVGGLTNKFKEAGQAVQLQEQLMNRTKNVIKTTGGAAGVSAKQILSMSDAIERKTTLDSEAIQSGANLLLTFTNVRNEAGKGNDIFNQTTSIMSDMATALGTEPKQAALQLGKALNDPVKGVSALSRVGVSFTEQQKKQIKTLVDSGDTMGAQKIILKELNKEFGGAGKAAGKTAAGQFKHFKDAVDTVFENIVKIAIPILLKIIGFLSANLPKAIKAVQPTLDKMKAAFSAVFAKIQPVIEKFVNFLKANPEAVKAFAITIGVLATALGIVAAATAAWNAVLALNPIGLVVVAIAGLVAGLVLAYKHSETFRNIVNAAFSAIKTVVAAVFPIVKAIIVTTFKVVAAYVRTYVTVIRVVVTTAFKVIAAVTRAVWAVFKAVIVAPVKFVANLVGSAVGKMKSAISSAWGAIKSATQKIWNAFKGYITTGVNAGIAVVKGIKSKITGVFSSAGTWLKDAGKRIIQGLIDGIQSLIEKALGLLRDLTKKIPKVKGPAAKDAKLLKPAGQLIIQGLIEGFRSEIPNVYKTLNGLTAGIAGFSGDLSPSMSVSAGSGSGSVTHVTVYVTAPVGASSVDIGRELERHLNAYAGHGGRRAA